MPITPSIQARPYLNQMSLPPNLPTRQRARRLFQQRTGQPQCPCSSSQNRRSVIRFGISRRPAATVTCVCPVEEKAKIDICESDQWVADFDSANFGLTATQAQVNNHECSNQDGEPQH